MAATIPQYIEFARQGLNKIHRDVTAKYEKQYPRFVKSVTTTEGFYRVQQISGFGPSQVVNEGHPIPMDARVKGGSQDIYPVMMGNGYACTKQAKYTDYYALAAKNGPDMSVAHLQTKERVIARLRNRAFSTTALGPNGSPLCSYTQPSASGVPTRSNRGNGTVDLTLSALNLERGMVALRTQRNFRGAENPIPGPFYLEVHPVLEPLATRIVGSNQLQGTADNDMNYVRGRVEVLVCDYFTSETAWFLRPRNDMFYNLYHLTRIPFEVEADYITLNKVYVWTFAEEMAVFWSDFVGFYGGSA